MPSFRLIFPKVYALGLGPINLFLIEAEGGLTLIDTGYQNSETRILAALQQLGRQPADLKHIIITHCHPDHAGSLAALQRLTHAPAWMHPADAPVVRGEKTVPPPVVAPGWKNALLFRLFIQNVAPQVPAAVIEHELQDGQTLPFADGLRAIHTPGHSAGHLALLFPHAGGLLFVGDACSHMAGLDYSIVYDDLEEARRSLAKLARLDFRAVCFSHGGLLTDARRFKAKWA